MKKTILLAFMALGLTFVSCNKDDDGTPEEQQAASVQGVWQLQSKSNDGELEVIDDCELETTLEMKADKSFTITNKYLENQECMSSTATGSYEIVSEGKMKITITNDGETDTFNLDISVASNLFTLTENDEEDGVSVTKYIRK